MKKRWTAFFLAFLLGFGLTACGKTPGPDTNTDAPPSAAEDIRQQTSAPFSADYWTAVRHESYDAMNDCMKTSAMPRRRGGRTSISTKTERPSFGMC